MVIDADGTVVPGSIATLNSPWIKLDTNTGGVNETFFLHFLQGKYFARVR